MLTKVIGFAMTSKMYAFQELARTFVHYPRVNFALLHSSSGGCDFRWKKSGTNG
jgi:hypothetical protein